MEWPIVQLTLAEAILCFSRFNIVETPICDSSLVASQCCFVLADLHPRQALLGPGRASRVLRRPWQRRRPWRSWECFLRRKEGQRHSLVGTGARSRLLGRWSFRMTCSGLVVVAVEAEVRAGRWTGG